jgi:anti-sigma regulatory factor (Ser/Thr protein kinase)
MATDYGRSLQLEASQQSLDAVLDVVQSVALEAGISQGDLIRFESAVMEVVDNIVVHGGATQLWVSIDVAGGWIRAVAEDNGPRSPVELEAAEMPSDLEESGRGLAMATSLLDEFRYERDHQRNVWTLGVELSS